MAMIDVVALSGTWKKLRLCVFIDSSTVQGLSSNLRKGYRRRRAIWSKCRIQDSYQLQKLKSHNAVTATLM